MVAEQTYLLRAARRLGLRLPAACAGRGGCDSCTVHVKAGAKLLSPPTALEDDWLGPEKLAAGERLSCQARIEQTGAVTFGAVTLPKTEEDDMRDFHKEFSELSLTQKFATLVRLEATALHDALGAVMGLPSQISSMGVDFMADKGRAAEAEERASAKPDEHQSQEQEADGGKQEESSE